MMNIYIKHVWAIQALFDHVLATAFIRQKCNKGMQQEGAQGKREDVSVAIVTSSVFFALFPLLPFLSS